MSAPLYRDFLTQAELDREYDVEGSVADFASYRERFEAASREAIAQLKPHLRVPYGPTRAEYLDLYESGAEGGPVLVYFHGGYWRMLASEDFAFAARGPVANGITVVNVNYALCPTVTIDEIVRQARAAVAWTYRTIARHGGNPGRLYVGGHSAGAHLAAMCLVTRWSEDYGLPDDLLRGGALVGGLYDLRPLPYTFVQPQLQLDWGQILRNSPTLSARRTLGGPLLIAYGERETSEFRRQSRAFADAWAEAGNAAPRVLIQDGADHFSSALEMFETGSWLTRALAELVAGPQAQLASSA